MGTATTVTAMAAAATDRKGITGMLWLTRVQSHSMAPTLPGGALALTRRLWRRTPVRRGDVVVVDSRELGRHVVKRIVGLPGETVAIEAGRVSINGQPLAEPYASRSVFTDTFHVHAGHYLLLGDHRDASSDSRSWRQPYIARAALIGRLIGRGWSWPQRGLPFAVERPARTRPLTTTPCRPSR